MNIHLKAKKIVVFMLLLFVFAYVIQPDNVCAETDTEINQAEIQSFLMDFFTDFLSTLDKDSTKDFSREDFASINGYITAKLLVDERERDKILSTGTYDVQTHEVAIEDISCHNDTIEVMTYVKYSNLYENDEEGSRSFGGLQYRVTLAHTETGYCVQDIDLTHSYIASEAKAAILGSSVSETMDEADLLNRSEEQREADYAAADAYFEKSKQDAEDMLNVQYPAVEEDEIEETEIEVEPLSVSVSYNAKKARNYGYKLGKYKENYIFKRAKEDCTNFVSQCVWAGYGGTAGVTIPETPTVNDRQCIALKNRVKANRRMTSTWYGRNYDSSLGDPPTQFCGVENFCSYVTSNTGDGPKAVVYNNGKVYTKLTKVIKFFFILHKYL